MSNVETREREALVSNKQTRSRGLARVDTGSKRMLEFDLVRGLCLLGMVFHHIINNVRYLYRIDMFGFQETDLFNYLLRPPFLIGFIMVSGLSSAFSRNQFKRAGRIALAAIVLQIAMAVFSQVQQANYYVIFNVLHVLAVSQFLYGLVEWFFRKRSQRSFLMALGVIAVLAVFAGYSLQELNGDIANPLWGYFRLIMGAPYDHAIGMGDFMPLFPWLGVFFLGALLSHTVYNEKRTLLSDQAHQFVSRYLKPLVWMGQYPLWVYLLHQPIILGVMYLLLGSP